MTEWYANGPLGVEQGFDVAARPSAGGGPLSLSLALSSNLRARPDGRTGAVLYGTGGSLRYGGLSATDAHGRALPSWLEVRSHRLMIRVDDRNAVYPVRIDPFIQQAELTASDGRSTDLFAASLAISNDTIVASAPLHKVGAHQNPGAVYVFVKPASGWANGTQTAELTASDASDSLDSVAIAGNTIVAGSTAHKVGANSSQGAVYVFVKPAVGWKNATETAALTAADGAANDALGSAVGVSGDSVVASAPGHNVLGRANHGAAYVFVKPATGWRDETQTAELTATDGVARDSLDTVSISGDTVVAGVPQHPVGANADQGAAYVFVKPSSGWADVTQSSELTASDAAAGDQLGIAAAISGDTVVLGAPFHQVGLKQEGAAYVFVKTFAGWSSRQTQNAELTPSDGATNDRFGAAVGASGNRIIVGSIAHQVGVKQGQGAAYLFDRPGNTWTSTTQSAELIAADGAAGDEFSDPVAISGNVALAGSPLRAVGANSMQGAAYVFGPPPTIAIGTPSTGTTFSRDQVVRASYACFAPPGATITSCTGPVAAGARIDTTTPGRHSFPVKAIDSDGLTAARSAFYVVSPTARPSITSLRQSALVWREGNKLPLTARLHRLPVGTTISFVLNERANVTLHFARRTIGRKIRGRCATRHPGNQHNAHCTLISLAGTLRLTANRGTNRIRFAGRLSRSRTLIPGHYSLELTAINAVDQTARSQSLRFAIVR